MGFTYKSASDILEKFQELRTAYFLANKATDYSGLSKTRANEWQLLDLTIQATSCGGYKHAYSAKVITAVAMLIVDQMRTTIFEASSARAFKEIVGISEDNTITSEEKLALLKGFHAFYKKEILNESADGLKDGAYTNTQDPKYLLAFCRHAIAELGNATVQHEQNILDAVARATAAKSASAGNGWGIFGSSAAPKNAVAESSLENGGVEEEKSNRKITP